eukprot:TRINITY_DN3642_c0_g1_i1.p2 TRINITY_DN3642_c0_g1~~TRINITY_DN3642_c0_g1_i1.p2  ORF type:complete len:211 (-),score=20.96 TRINITY_DN3642_c0_g1_i1:390-1022(-)
MNALSISPTKKVILVSFNRTFHKQRCNSVSQNHVQQIENNDDNFSRRNLLNTVGVVGVNFINVAGSKAVESGLCDSDCVASLDGIEMITTSTGLQYKDIVVGKGPQPKTGYQVVCNYVAMTPEGRVFDSSLEKGYPYDIRVGTEAVVAGLDEGLQTMKVGGIRRLYVPGNLSFPNGLKSGPGRPRILPNSPVMFDVQLLYIPGLEDEEEE